MIIMSWPKPYIILSRLRPTSHSAISESVFYVSSSNCLRQTDGTSITGCKRTTVG